MPIGIHTQTHTHTETKNKLITVHSYFKLKQLMKMNGKRKYERRNYLNADCGKTAKLQLEE